ncbi:uncharacterized protein LOC102712590 [Oryza brachyantha]|uniref:uncharacterized protein LOC102712590 n=1 Tax=Oryza brachyantha TaxID=4533 RepID=UPI001ADA95DF|nr:uncharacterized protein LOC102712590 [Oryza brachyantha]
MTELAAGAVSSLLVVIRDERRLLSRVGDDVQFIKEEMESMNSFLAHLARSAPVAGDHDEQVRTWMNQVRLLAQDCNNCIDLYLYSGNPEIHRAKGKFRRHFWWVYWSMRKMVAQHRAAVQLRQLKDRARDVGKRRLRYGVEVPAKSAAAGQSPTTKAAAPDDVAGDDEEEDYEDQLAVATATHHSSRRAVFEPLALDEYARAKLMKWKKGVPKRATMTLSIAVVVADADNKKVLDLANEILVAPNYKYHRSIMVNVPEVHADFLPLRPKEVLYYILRELEPAGYQKQATDQGDSWKIYYNIYRSKKKVIRKIKRNIEKMNFYKKLDKFKSDIKEKIKSDSKDGQQKSNKQLWLHQKKKVDHGYQELLDLVLRQFQPEQAKNDVVDMCKLSEWKGDLIKIIAMKLKKYMEADEKTKELNEHIRVEKTTTKQGRGERQEENYKGEGKGEEGREEENEKEKDHGDGEEEENEEERKDKEEEEEIKEERHHEKMKQEQKEREEERKEEQNEENEGRKEEQVRREEKEENKYSDDDEDVEEDDYDEEEEEDDDDDDDDDDDPIHLHQVQYAQILREVFPNITRSKNQQQDKSEAKQAIKTVTVTLDETEIKQMINEARQDILRDLRGGKLDKNQEICEPDVPLDKNEEAGEHAGVLGQNEETYFEEIDNKIEDLKGKLKEQLKIKGLVDKIKHHLQGECPLIILKFDNMMDGSRWEEIRKALSLLKSGADALILTTESTEQAKGYCYPAGEPIDYSLVGLYHYMVLQLTSKKKDEDNYNPQIFRDILEECEGHKFCMKIFTHAMYANPRRTNEELSKLHRTLQDSQKSFDTIAKNMFMYSYNDLPKEYKSYLLYLAIFPKGQKIRRSTLIGRWVTEGLTFKEDWPSSVRQAKQCFDTFIRRWLVRPADISAMGNVKSCMVDDTIHGFITAIARKQHIVETRLSHHLARHFSIFNDLRLRSSDEIETFLKSLSRTSRVSLLKVLDLEGCQCFGGKNQRYLKDICSKMLLLKYLSLKGTDITQLPSEINCLRELEVLDIRETKVPANTTVNVLLLKLKRLLGGHIEPSSRNFGTSIQIPHKVDKMLNIEVLTNVKAQRRRDLEDIGKLWQLKKLGVVIDGKITHLKSFLKAISDLHECIRSLSITIPATMLDGTPSSQELLDDIGSRLKDHPKILENLRINGARHLFPLLTKGDNSKLAKVTLRITQLKQDDMDVLAKLPRLQCVRLQHISCTESSFIFKKDDFKCLKYFIIEGFNLTNITFEDGSARELEKMVLSSTSIESISGVDVLPKFKELVLNDSTIPSEVKEVIESNERIKLKHNEA